MTEQPQDIDEKTFDEAVELAARPRTTLNEWRMNKLLKRAKLEQPQGKFGKRKGGKP